MSRSALTMEPPLSVPRMELTSRHAYLYPWRSCDMTVLSSQEDPVPWSVFAQLVPVIFYTTIWISAEYRLHNFLDACVPKTVLCLTCLLEKHSGSLKLDCTKSRKWSAHWGLCSLRFIYCSQHCHTFNSVRLVHSWMSVPFYSAPIRIVMLSCRG